MKKHICRYCLWKGIKKQMYPWVNIYRNDRMQLDCPSCGKVLFRTKKVKKNCH